ncbi:MAG: hypothetical protein E7239_08115 [Sarcina sp.]|nr:hypothetical protein [Sarcina sp.]
MKKRTLTIHRILSAATAMLVAGSLIACGSEGARGSASSPSTAEESAVTTENGAGAGATQSPEAGAGATDEEGGLLAGGLQSNEAAIEGFTSPDVEVAALTEEDISGQNPVMNFIGRYYCDRCVMTVATKENSEKGAEITVQWGGSAWESAEWRMSGDLDMETLTIEYDDCVKSEAVCKDGGELESETEIYRNGKGRIVFQSGLGSRNLMWEDDEEHIADGFVFEYNSYDGEESGSVGMANPWRDVTEEEAASVVTHLFRVPEGAENVMWSMMDAGEAQEAEGEEVSPLVQLFFEMDGTQFTARAKQGGDPEEDISGMYYDWDATEDIVVGNWNVPGKIYSFMEEGDNAQLCSWRDEDTATSYSLAANGSDLDGLDLTAVAAFMYK